ncbi:MAG TPA: 2'-5' RNA ligase family protein [Streptosporangiaceae bacterium]
MSYPPSQMINRWEHRPEPNPGQGQLYWHVLFQDEPRLQALASLAQEKLSSFPGLDLTPKRWLHLTVMVAGIAEEFVEPDLKEMVAQAHQLLSSVPPITVTFGKVLYHPEAVLLGVRSAGALAPVYRAVRDATRNVKRETAATGHDHWIPHVTLAYSTAVQPLGPIIAALGHELPRCEVTIRHVSLVIQEGPERLWDWQSIAEIPLLV